MMKKVERSFFQNIMKTSTPEEIEIIKNKFNLKYSESIVVKEPTSTYNKKENLEEELISLLQYAPKPLLQNFINKLKEIKEFNETI